MKTLSVHQPYATLICAGVKDVENRSWKTDYRGPLLIHASQVSFAWPDANYLPETFLKRCEPWIGKEDLTDLPDDLRRYHEIVLWTCKHYHVEYKHGMDLEWLKDAVKEYGAALPMFAIVGEVELVDIVKDSNSEFAEDGYFHWLVENPVLYDNPITNVVGRLRIWNFER